MLQGGGASPPSSTSLRQGTKIWKVRSAKFSILPPSQDLKWNSPYSMDDGSQQAFFLPCILGRNKSKPNGR